MTFIALIPAAGVGTRFGSKKPKQYHHIAGKAVLTHTLKILSSHDKIDLIALILSTEDTDFNENMLPENCCLYDPSFRLPEIKTTNTTPVLPLYMGAEQRAKTVFNGLDYLLKQQIIQKNDMVLVHDAARCCLPKSALQRLIQAAPQANEGAILALPIPDTLKKTNGAHIIHTVDRNHLWRAQTPQMFQAALLHRALQQTNANKITDEASAIEELGLKPLLVQGDSRNIKLTYPEDEYEANRLLNGDNTMRIGQGYDVHQLVDHRPLILGGVHIPFHKGLLGHSDADALLHAITDALLGAAGLGDIGKHFPDNSAKFKDADSRELLRHAYQSVQAASWQVINIDCTIIAQAPKLQPYIASMCANIANDLQIDISLINIKGKTNEKLGYLGRQEAIEAQAVVLLKHTP